MGNEGVAVESKKEEILESRVKVKDGLGRDLEIEGPWFLRKTEGRLTSMTIPLSAETYAKSWKGTEKEKAPDVKIHRVDLKNCPTYAELSYLWHKVIGTTTREVMLVWGLSRAKDERGNRRRVYLVPKQEASFAGVEHKDKEGIAEFAVKASVCGTIHSHPGSGIAPSGTDTSSWEEFPGVHVILGRSREFGLYATEYDRCIPLGVGKIPEEGFEKMKSVETLETLELIYSGGLPLEDLLEEEKPTYFGRGNWNYGDDYEGSGRELTDFMCGINEHRPGLSKKERKRLQKQVKTGGNGEFYKVINREGIALKNAELVRYNGSLYVLPLWSVPMSMESVSLRALVGGNDFIPGGIEAISPRETGFIVPPRRDAGGRFLTDSGEIIDMGHGGVR